MALRYIPWWTHIRRGNNTAEIIRFIASLAVHIVLINVRQNPFHVGIDCRTRLRMMTRSDGQAICACVIIKQSTYILHMTAWAVQRAVTFGCVRAV